MTPVLEFFNQLTSRQTDTLTDQEYNILTGKCRGVYLTSRLADILTEQEYNILAGKCRGVYITS